MCYDIQETDITKGLLYKGAYRSLTNLLYCSVNNKAQLDIANSMVEDLDKRFLSIIERVVPALRVSPEQEQVIVESKQSEDSKNIQALEQMAGLGPIKGSFDKVLTTLDSIIQTSKEITEDT